MNGNKFVLLKKKKMADIMKDIKLGVKITPNVLPTLNLESLTLSISTISTNDL